MQIISVFISNLMKSLQLVARLFLHVYFPAVG